jgi:hypothetical protein
MRVKKPLLLFAFLLFLLVVTLILPAVSQAAPKDNQPVSWARSGGNTSNDFRDLIGWQGGSSVLVKQLADGSTVGHVTMQTMKDVSVTDPRFRAKTTEFIQAATLFHEGDYIEPISHTVLSGKIAEFEVVSKVEWGNGELHSRWVLIDGGEPPTSGDLVLIYYWGPDLYPPLPAGWVPFFDPFAIVPGTADGNVQVHIAGE